MHLARLSLIEFVEPIDELELKFATFWLKTKVLYYKQNMS